MRCHILYSNGSYPCSRLLNLKFPHINIFACNLLQVIYSDEDRKFKKDITVGLIRSELLNLAEYNVHMAKLIDGGRNSM